MSYRHVQKGRIHYYLLLIGLVLIVSAWFSRAQPPAVAICLSGAAMFTLLAFMFGNLLIEDRGDNLTVQFGPVGLFRKHVPYSSIRSVEPGKSTLLDGLGIHWVPGRGWIWNLWGSDCVVLELENGTLRLGTDDVENLCRFLEEKIEKR